jgi:hypothetical protein
MNSKNLKKVRRKAKHILVEWLHSLLSKEEASKINVKNILNFMPYQTHYFDGTTIRLQPWSYKWIVTKLKINPMLTFDNLNDMLRPTEKDLRRNKMIEEGPIKDDR